MENGIQAYQKKYLKGLAHQLKPVVFIGQNGLTEKVLAAIDQALTTHELIKIKFIDFKEKPQKLNYLNIIVNRLKATDIGMIGHITILYRQQPDEKKRTITLPKR